AVAGARLRQAREAVVQARADLLPTVGASAGARRDILSNGSDRTNLSLDTDASWEADLFGRLSRGVEAARAEEERTGFDLAAIQVSVTGDLVATYVEARRAQQRLAIARDSLAISDENLDIARWRARAGLVSS